MEGAVVEARAVEWVQTLSLLTVLPGARGLAFAIPDSALGTILD